MPDFDVTDEIIIDADASRVFGALLEEFVGASAWWAPHFKIKSGDVGAFGQPGGTCQVNVGPTQFTLTSAVIDPDHRLLVKYSGDYIGEGLWTLNPEGDKTRLSYRWQVRPGSLKVKLIAMIVNISERHSAVMLEGFKGLKAHLAISS